MKESSSISNRIPGYQDPSNFIDPKNIRILVVDSKGPSRQTVCSLLRDCAYQVSQLRQSILAMSKACCFSRTGPKGQTLSVTIAFVVSGSGR